MICRKITLIAVLILTSLIVSSCQQVTPDSLHGQQGLSGTEVKQPIIPSEDTNVQDESSSDIASEPTNQMEDKNAQEEYSQEEDLAEPQIQTSSSELPDRDFEVDELFIFISNMTGTPKIFRADNRTDFSQDMKKKGHIFYTSNNQFKNWVVEVIENKDDQLVDGQAFYDYAGGQNWIGWKYYTNQTWWDFIHDPLTEKELENMLPQYNYKTKYRTDLYSDWIDRNEKEEAFENNLGKFLRYQLIAIEFTPETEDHYWIGNWGVPFMQIYKIPCTKDTIVYYRPDYKYTNEAGFANQKIESVLKLWDGELQVSLKEVTPYSEQIMEYCGVSKETFQDVDFQDYENHAVKVFNWKVYFFALFNYSMEAQANIEPIKKDEDIFKIEQLNLTFKTFTDERDLRSLRVKIELENEQRSMIEYGDFIIVSEKMDAGDTFNKSVSVDHSPFRKNTTLILRPYYGYEESIDAYKYYLGEPIRVPLT
ncbi:hypothetical protein JW826_03935 [Candidatus Woesearchaeota archaeon]|nr:hypothetical protein [Candidatus Woesearchaeota archaeon]